MCERDIKALYHSTVLPVGVVSVQCGIVCTICGAMGPVGTTMFCWPVSESWLSSTGSNGNGLFNSVILLYCKYCNIYEMVSNKVDALINLNLKKLYMVAKYLYDNQRRKYIITNVLQFNGFWTITWIITLDELLHEFKWIQSLVNIYYFYYS